MLHGLVVLLGFAYIFPAAAAAAAAVH